MSGYCSRDCLPCINDCGLAGKPNPTLAEAFPATVCPTCGSDDPDYLPPVGDDPDVRVACLDPWHDEGTAHLPAEGYGHDEAFADLHGLLCYDDPHEHPEAAILGERCAHLAAYIERLETNACPCSHECQSVADDRDRYKAEAERWERSARVLAKALETLLARMRDEDTGGNVKTRQRIGMARTYADRVLQGMTHEDAEAEVVRSWSDPSGVLVSWWRVETPRAEKEADGE